MLRDALRLHPNLACPEETSFLRWGEAPGTDNFNRMLGTNPVLKHHRELDGITEDEFRAMLAACTSRGDLYRRYMALFIERRKPGARRWFDKTPQNVYGALLAATTIERSRFVHIVRDPRNVAASLRIGKVVKVGHLNGAIAYWTEAVQIMNGLKKAYPGRVLEIRYEDFVADPQAGLRALLDWLGESYDPAWFASVDTRLVDHAQEGVLTPAELEQVVQGCRRGMRRHGYLPPHES